MTSLSRLSRVLACVALCAALPGCKKGAQSLCQSDQSCAPGFTCNAATGACGCASDSACAQAESCNAEGFCQPRLRCASTADCASGFICDSPSGTCIAQGSCTIDVQCPVDQVCKNFACVQGCNKSGDCRISEVCRPCPPGTPSQQCLTGSLCVAGHCDSQLSCRYGEICAPAPGAPASDPVCQKDTRGPFCASCVLSPGSGTYCGTPANYCLIDASVPFPQAFFCGVDCTQPGQECPNGYYCHDVRIVRAEGCTQANGLSACAAPPASSPCDPAKTHPGAGGVGLVNDDCDAVQPPLVGAVCDPKTSRCVAQCLGTGEAGVDAFCSCIEDSDCPSDSCDSAIQGGTCRISGAPCVPGTVPDQCQSTHRIFCVKESDPRLGEVGYCRIGQDCAPGEGFTCAILRSPN